MAEAPEHSLGLFTYVTTSPRDLRLQSLALITSITNLAHKFGQSIISIAITINLGTLYTERMDPHDVIVQKFLRAKLLNSVSESDKRRFSTLSDKRRF
jgi:hypothetical protein